VDRAVPEKDQPSLVDLLYAKLIEFEPKLDRLLTALREEEAAQEREKEQLGGQGENGRE
jgi:hypothetical protein